MSFPRKHQKRIRTNFPLERLNLEIERRTRVVVTIPDANQRANPQGAALAIPRLRLYARLAISFVSGGCWWFCLTISALSSEFVT